MSSLYVLYIDDAVVGPSLELIRRVCEPDSTSKPHLTVRGPIKTTRRRKNYPWRQERISEIQMIKPAAFFSEEEDTTAQNTVSIQCYFKNLASIYYKPDLYRTTRLPHITLYDGDSRRFAEHLLRLLKTFQWGFKVHLPKRFNVETGTIDYPILTELILNKKGKREKRRIQYDSQLRALFYQITSERLDYESLRGLNDSQRLALVSLIYKYVEKYVRFDTDFEITRTGFSGVMPEAGETIQYTDKRQETFRKSPDSVEARHGQLRLLEHVQTQANAKPRHLRSRLGQFLTPPELAIDIAEYVKTLLPKPSPSIHFGDPAIGTGTFFSALRQVFPVNCLSSAFGVEIDTSIASMTEAAWSSHGLKVIKGDYFDVRLPPKRNIILCNPPYVRHHYMSKIQKDTLRTRVKYQLGIEVSGLSGLYLYFMLLCHQWMEENAIAAWLVPTEFMEVNYGAAIRQYLTERVSTILVHRFDPKEVQFDGVIVTSCVVVLQNKPPAADSKTRFTFGGTLLNPTRTVEVSTSELRSRTKWPVNIGCFNNQNSPSIRLRDLFVIRRGLATGANTFFILTREQARQQQIPASCLRPILPSPRKLSTEIVRAEADGYPRLAPQLCLIDCQLPEIELRKRYPKLWEYLKTADDKLIRDRYLIKNRHPWYRQEKRPPPPFLCTYLGREGRNGGTFRFIWNRSSATAANQYLLLYPSDKLNMFSKKHPKRQELIFKLLQSISMSALHEGGRVYGGGLYKLEPRELGAIPADSFLSLVNSAEWPRG